MLFSFIFFSILSNLTFLCIDVTGDEMFPFIKLLITSIDINVCVGDFLKVRLEIKRKKRRRKKQPINKTSFALINRLIMRIF